MRVQMKVSMSGLRDGVEWPKAGEVATLPDDEAAMLISQGNAVPAKGAKAVEAAVPVEAAVAPADEETATAPKTPGPRPGPRAGK